MAKFVDEALKRVDAAQQRHRWLSFVVAVVKKHGDDRGGQLAGLIAYYAFLSLLPLFLVFVTVLGFVLEGDPRLRRELVGSAVADFPVIGSQLRHNVHALGGSGLTLVIGLVLLLWGSLGVAYAVQHATAEVWNVPVHERPGFGDRLLRALALLVVLALGVIGTSILTSIVASSGTGAAFEVLGVATTLAFNVMLYLGGLRVVTRRSVATRDLVAGAAIGGVAWTVLELAGSWLVARQLRHTSELYGFFAIVLGLLFWLYLAAQVFVFASESNVVRARRLWPRSLAPPPLTPADEETFTALAEKEARRPEEHVDVHFDRDVQQEFRG